MHVRVGLLLAPGLLRLAPRLVPQVGLVALGKLFWSRARVKCWRVGASPVWAFSLPVIRDPVVFALAIRELGELGVFVAMMFAYRKHLKEKQVGYSRALGGYENNDKFAPNDNM